LNRIIAKIALFILISTLILSCNVVKKVPNSKYLLTKNELLVNGKLNLNEEITSQIVQQPNTSILGLRLRLNIYNLAKNNTDSIFRAKYTANPKKYTRKSKWLSKKQVDRLGQSFWYSGIHSFLKKTGEPPVIIDSLKVKKSVKRLKSYFFNNGFFDADVAYKITYNTNKRATIKYTVVTGKPTFVDTISTNIRTPILDTLYLESKSKSFLKQGEQYKTDNLINERTRLTDYYRNHGVYFFQQQSIGFEVDTLNDNFKAPITINITNQEGKFANNSFSKPYVQYRINQVNIFADETARKQKNQVADSVIYKNFHLYSTNKLRYRPKAITNAIFIQKDSLYSDLDRTLTLRSLSNLKMFKYPNIQFIEDTLTKTLQANIYLASEPKFNFKANADFTRSNIQIFGITGSSSVFMRNVFRGAEILELGLRGNIGSSKDLALADTRFFNISEVGADLRLLFPRLFLPFNSDKIVPKSMLPSSSISIGFSKQTNIGLDKENFSGVLSYSWLPKKHTVSKVDLVNVQYVKNVNTANYFNVYSSTYNLLNTYYQFYTNTSSNLGIDNGEADNFIANVLANQYPNLQSENPDYKTIKSINERKIRLSENNLIFAANYTFSKDTQTDLFDKEFYVFKTKIESAGNALSLISNVTKQPKNADGTRDIFGLQYSQYIKGEFEFIKNWDLYHGNTIAVRSFFGIAIPYGNSNSIPFSRSYFAGGSNDNRAWQSYSLGPGSSGGLNDFNEANMKIALNAELRFKLFGALNGAFFADCGNIWNVLDSETDETKIFSGIKSLETLALGTGFGIRYDFKFFIARLDLGFKTFNPAKLENERWFKELNFSKSVINIAVNYPF